MKQNKNWYAHFQGTKKIDTRVSKFINSIKVEDTPPTDNMKKALEKILNIK